MGRWINGQFDNSRGFWLTSLEAHSPPTPKALKTNEGLIFGGSQPTGALPPPDIRLCFCICIVPHGSFLFVLCQCAFLSINIFVIALCLRLHIWNPKTLFGMCVSTPEYKALRFKFNNIVVHLITLVLQELNNISLRFSNCTYVSSGVLW
uniref:Uncharacterized protein n=1 Tax=Hippocampus comes TaxID=109280 RepID=A0A3Q2YUL0_HIPCM